jgi:hypothetical protein
MNTQHTPGPWNINGGRIEGPNAYTSTATVIGVVGEISNQSFTDTANARLIAAAPEMLKALQSIATRASCAPNDDAKLAGQEFDRIMQMARAAIAKAKGE